MTGIDEHTIKKVPSLDVNRFFKYGYAVTFVTSNHYLRLLEAVNETPWINDPAGIYHRVPAWRLGASRGGNMGRISDTGASIAEQTLDSCPGAIKGAINAIISDPMVIASLGDFYRLKLDFVDLWDGVEKTLGWHWDGPDQSSLISIIYLNDTHWPSDGGGELAVGERNLPCSSNWLTDYEAVTELLRVPPAGRTQVWINNANPRFVHRPFPLKDGLASRLSLTFGCSLIPC